MVLKNAHKDKLGLSRTQLSLAARETIQARIAASTLT
jgi:hypothetical protein